MSTAVQFILLWIGILWNDLFPFVSDNCNNSRTVTRNTQCLVAVTDPLISPLCNRQWTPRPKCQKVPPIIVFLSFVVSHRGRCVRVPCGKSQKVHLPLRNLNMLGIFTLRVNLYMNTNQTMWKFYLFTERIDDTCLVK